VGEWQGEGGGRLGRRGKGEGKGKTYIMIRMNDEWAACIVLLMGLMIYTRRLRHVA